MARVVTLGLAGWRAALECEDKALEQGLARAFAAFVAPGPVHSHVRVVSPEEVRLPPATRSLPEPRPVAGGGLRVEAEDFTAEIGVGGQEATVVGGGRFGVETVLKIMLAGWLARQGGLLVHGVGVEHRGRAALWVGPSGAGKSTLGSLWARQGGTVLADELVAVWPGAEGWRAAGTPWNVGAPVEGALRAVGTLAWEAAPSWQPASASAVARVLLLNALLPESSPAGRSYLLAAASRLLGAVQGARLAFALEPSVGQVLRAELERP